MIGYSVPQNRSPRSALNELVPQGRAGRGAAGVAQKPGQDSPDRREAGGGLSARKRASDSLKPSGAHLATKARYAPVGDRAGIGLGE